MGGWHLGDWPELWHVAGWTSGRPAPAAPRGLRCSLIKLTSHRGPPPCLPFWLQACQLEPDLEGGRRGHVGGGRALTTGPFAVQSDTLRRLSFQRADSACPEPRRQGRSEGWQACFGGLGLLPCPLSPAQSRRTVRCSAILGKSPPLSEPPCCHGVCAKHSEGTQQRSCLLATMLVMKTQSPPLKNTAPKPGHLSVIPISSLAG